MLVVAVVKSQVIKPQRGDMLFRRLFVPFNISLLRSFHKHNFLFSTNILPLWGFKKQLQNIA